MLEGVLERPCRGIAEAGAVVALFVVFATIFGCGGGPTVSSLGCRGKCACAFFLIRYEPKCFPHHEIPCQTVFCGAGSWQRKEVFTAEGLLTNPADFVVSCSFCCCVVTNYPGHLLIARWPAILTVASQVEPSPPTGGIIAKRTARQDRGRLTPALEVQKNA